MTIHHSYAQKVWRRKEFEVVSLPKMYIDKDDEENIEILLVNAEKTTSIMTLPFARLASNSINYKRSLCPWLQRHLEFIKRKGAAYSYGFEWAIFTQTALFTRLQSLRRAFLKTHSPFTILFRLVLPFGLNEM